MTQQTKIQEKLRAFAAEYAGRKWVTPAQKHHAMQVFNDLRAAADALDDYEGVLRTARDRDCYDCGGGDQADDALGRRGL